MKYSKRTILAATLVTAVAITGVAAAQSDLQLIKIDKPLVRNWNEPTKEAETTEPTPPENAENGNLDQPENHDSNSGAEASPSIEPTTPIQTPTNNEVAPNEPAPQVEADPTPEPLPAPDTNITNVQNSNSVLGNNSTGTVSHN